MQHSGSYRWIFQALSRRADRGSTGGALMHRLARGGLARLLGTGVMTLALVGVQHVATPVVEAVVSSGATTSDPGSHDWPSSPVSPGPCPSVQISVTGWLTTVWGAAPRYWITDDQGQRAEVLLDEDLARPFGGPQSLDRRRVTVVGDVVRHEPLLIRALTIEPDLS